MYRTLPLRSPLAGSAVLACAVAGAQDGDHAQFFTADNRCIDFLNRCFDTGEFDRQVAGDFIREHLADFAQQAAEIVGWRIFAAHQRQLVLHQRVLNFSH